MYGRRMVGMLANDLRERLSNLLDRSYVHSSVNRYLHPFAVAFCSSLRAYFSLSLCDILCAVATIIAFMYRITFHYLPSSWAPAFALTSFSTNPFNSLTSSLKLTTMSKV